MAPVGEDVAGFEVEAHRIGFRFVSRPPFSYARAAVGRDGGSAWVSGKAARGGGLAALARHSGGGGAANLAPTAFLYLVALAESLPRAAPQIPPIAAMMMAWLATLFLFPIALGQTLVMGVPLHMLLVALRLSAPWAYALAGMLGGGLALGALNTLRLGEANLLTLMGPAAGLAAALVFRAIWRPLPGSG